MPRKWIAVVALALGLAAAWWLSDFHRFGPAPAFRGVAGVRG